VAGNEGYLAEALAARGDRAEARQLLEACFPTLEAAALADQDTPATRRFLERYRRLRENLREPEP
jgi:hypothetical protein